MIGNRNKFNDHEVNQTEQTAHDKYANELNKSSVSSVYSYTEVNYLFMRVVIIVYNFCHVYKLKGRSLV